MYFHYALIIVYCNFVFTYLVPLPDDNLYQGKDHALSSYYQHPEEYFL